MLKSFQIAVTAAILVPAVAAATPPEGEPHIQARFDAAMLDADARGPGLLVGIPRPNTAPAERIYWDLSGQEIHVETWTRYYRTVAGASAQDPDRPDERSGTDYGDSSAALTAHEPDADMAVVPQEGRPVPTVSLSASTSKFQISDGYVFTNDALLLAPLSAVVDPDPPSDPSWFHAAGDTPNYELVQPESQDWARVEGDFTLTFLYGSIEIHNETGSYRVDARREHIAGTSPLYEEYSITRAFVHVTNGSAYVQPGGRPMQVNLAGYDIPAVSAVRLVNATGTWTGDGGTVPFEDANVRVAGDGLRLTAEPVSWGDDLFQRGRVGGAVEELFIDGRPVPVGSPETITAEPSQAPSGVSVVLLAAAVLAVLTAAWMVRRTQRRGQAGPLAEHARDLLDVEDYPGASFWAKEAIRRDPRHGEAASVLAIACLKMGDPDEAVAHLERVRSEDDPLVQFMLCVSLRHAGHPGQARHMLRELLQRHPELADLVSGGEWSMHGDTGADPGSGITGYG